MLASDVTSIAAQLIWRHSDGNQSRFLQKELFLISLLIRNLSHSFHSSREFLRTRRDSLSIVLCYIKRAGAVSQQQNVSEHIDLYRNCR